MSADDPIDLGEALETLVHQFSDPWSFLRELIQNAIDADSPEIDVRIDHQDGHDGGLMTVEVVDAGVGMDRQIIDTRLTRLFSSAKDGDYTKIGRFGIGFVSVFAIEPDLVCVDTGRTGEYWRVLFRKDRSFERIVLDTPIEGTTIRLFKRASPDEVEHARRRAHEVLEHWCKHARVDIRLDDRPISRPFSLDAHCVIEHDADDTRILLGYVESRAALRGYYHGGLTLHEERDDRLPHVAFKIDSRYLEHTLTRDNVIRDDNYDKAMAIVARLTRTRLVEALVGRLAELTQLAESGGESPDELELLRGRLVDVLADEDAPDVVFETPLIPALAGDGRMQLLSLAQVRELGKRCWAASGLSPVSAALLADGAAVLVYPPRSRLGDAIERACKRRPQHVSSLCTALACTSVEATRWQPLHDATLALLAKLGISAGSLRLGHVDVPGADESDYVAITQTKFGELTPLTEVGKLSSGWFGGKRIIVVNADHPTVELLLVMAEQEPELAAYLLLELFFLRTELDARRDDNMASFAAEARWQRRTA